MAHGQSLSVQEVTPPAINNNLGNMGVVGQYEGISQYTYEGQQNTVSTPYFDSMFAQIDNSTYLNQAISNGRVLAYCQLNETIYLSGNFTKFGNVNTPDGFASFNASSVEFKSISNRPNGTLNTLFCDASTNSIYVGGNFTFKNQSGSAIYNVDTDSWSVPLFGGFPVGSEINSIIPYNDSMIFGGSFNGLANKSFTGVNSSGNSTLLNSQRISFSLASIFADGSAPENDPKSIVCPSNNSNSNWAMEPNRVGSWNSIWPFYFNPTKLRLYNLQDEGNGVSLFRLRAFPSNGIMNLTYVNATTNQPEYCDAWCKLPLSSSESYVDFSLVNVIGMNGLQIEILDTYGSRGGLSGIEIHQNGKF